MRDGPFRRLPVVDNEGVLVGLIMLDDILVQFAREFNEIGNLIELKTVVASALVKWCGGLAKARWMTPAAAFVVQRRIRQFGAREQDGARLRSNQGGA